MKTKKIKQPDIIKAARKGSREAEIEMYGHPIVHNKIHQSNKSYNRAKEKTNLKKDWSFYIKKSKTHQKNLI